MLRDLDELMRNRAIDTLIVPMHEAMHSSFRWLSRGAKVTRGDAVKRVERKRKEPWEIDAIRSVGARTQQVVGGVRAMLRDCERGKSMTIGDLKSFVSSEIARLGMIEDHETILSQGRDAGVPHSRGNAAEEVRRSVPIGLA